ncbi:hypothetical protein [Ruegeria sp. HKCCD8929]|uniref:hypothetical protein n=1 Tax=Ruegeria sp. HKCCD8929 TaxID=2683006 RepID=UPI001488FCA5|nr:hypothetical protein [Ruegeria sp. HKCCD8929]
MGWLISQMSLGDVALYASIIAVLTANFGGFLFGRSANLEAAPLSCGNFSASAFLSNDGNHQAILAGVTLTAAQNTGSANIVSASFTAEGDGSDHRQLLPKAGRIYEITMANSDRPALASGLDLNASDCAISATFDIIQDASAKQSPFEIKEVCPCSDFAQSN